MSFAQIRAQISFNAIVVSIVIFYGVFGAYVFRTFEAQKSASATNNQRENFKEQLLKELWHHKNLEFDEWSTQVRSQLESYEKNLLLETSSSEWSLSDSWLFACSVFTTIGDGNIVPVSTMGRIFCILYGLVGIPLFSVVASSLASLITSVLQLLHSAYRRRRRQLDAGKQKKDEDASNKMTTEEKEEFHLTVMKALSLTAAYLAVGAMIFSLWEEWSLFESFYYCFVTLTTIGLGDYVPRNVHHTAFFGGYILLGLVLVTILFSAMEVEIAQHFDKIKQMVGLTEQHEEGKKEH